MTLTARAVFGFLSFIFVAFLLTDLPIGLPIYWWMPQWVLLAIIALSLHSPLLMGLKRSWLIGLLLDVLLGGLIGRYALICTLVSFVSGYIRLRFWIYTWWQQSLLVGLVIGFSQLLLFWIQALIEHPPQSWIYWGSSITSILFWPIFSVGSRFVLTKVFLVHSSI